MRQALHIFKKDARHLWLEITVVLLVTAAFTFIGARRAFWLDDPNANRSVAWIMAQLVLPFAWCILIARAVYAETLPGDRQFWTTRPYRWTSLLGAKLLFIGVFVNLPLLVADILILRAYGFAPDTRIAGLLWTQILFSAILLLPVAALCAVTNGFIQLLSASLVLLVVVLVWNTVVPQLTLFATWGALDWITVYYAILVAMLAAWIILIWQYARRKTGAARFVASFAAIAAMAGAAFPWTSAFAIQSRLSKQQIDASRMHVVFDSERKFLARARVNNNDDQVEIELPLAITGIPEGMEAKPDGLKMAIQSPDGTMQRGTRPPWMQIDSERQLLTLENGINGSFYRGVKDKPVKVRGTLYFTLYGNHRTTRIPFDGGRVAVPGIGICSASQARRGQMYFLLCASPFRLAPDLVSVHFVEQGEGVFREVAPYRTPWRVSYSPFPAELDISPVSQYFTFMQSPRELSNVVIDNLEPLAHVQRDFELDGLRLGEFEVHPPVR